MPRRCGRQSTRVNHPAETQKQYWRISLHYPFLDNLITSLNHVIILLKLTIHFFIFLLLFFLTCRCARHGVTAYMQLRLCAQNKNRGKQMRLLGMGTCPSLNDIMEIRRAHRQVKKNNNKKIKKCIVNFNSIINISLIRHTSYFCMVAM
jgi:hypothetical protein